MANVPTRPSGDSERAEEDRHEGKGPRSWVMRRLALSDLDYDIPVAANRFPYMLGGLTAALLVVLTATGLYLGQYYNPDPAGAYDSVRYLIARAPLGDWVRSLHWWAASGLVLTVVGHLAYVFYRRSYRTPREFTWWTGVGMAGLVFLLIVTGNVLPVDQEGIEALAHFVAGGEITGALGGFFTDSFTLSTPLITRMYALHTSAFPLLLFGLLPLHFWLIRHMGIRDEGIGSSTFSVHLRRLSAFALIGVGILGALAVLVPRGLGNPGVEGLELTRPFWALRWVYGLENLMGIWAIVISTAFLLLFLVSVPLIDRRPEDSRDRRGWLHWTALGVALVLLLLEVYGLWGPAGQHLGM